MGTPTRSPSPLTVSIAIGSGTAGLEGGLADGGRLGALLLTGRV
jgi:hypothetical protein